MRSDYREFMVNVRKRLKQEFDQYLFIWDKPTFQVFLGVDGVNDISFEINARYLFNMGIDSAVLFLKNIYWGKETWPGVSINGNKVEEESEVKHPGKILNERLLKHGMTHKEFAKCIDERSDTIDLILSGKRNLTVKTARSIAKFYGEHPRQWLMMQVDYDIWRTR